MVLPKTSGTVFREKKLHVARSKRSRCFYDLFGKFAIYAYEPTGVTDTLLLLF